MEIKTLENIDFEVLLHAFNESFSDYFVPLQLTLDQLKAKLKLDKVNFAYSVGAFIDQKLVGFILHGFDTIDIKRVVYNGGTGVIPAQRKQGLTQEMYDYILPTLRAENIDHLVLEVIVQNKQATKVYQKVGFNIVRKLICYKGAINASTHSQIRIEEMSEYNWEKLKSFWDFTPSWQNSTKVLEELRDTNKLFGAFMDDQLVGYSVYNPQSKRVQQFAVDHKCRGMKIGSSLFHHIGIEYEKNLSIINVDETSKSTNAFLTRIGLENFVEQLEMKLYIKQNQQK
ncbi:MAG: GNAT family N-acetyltransferase [Saprospiraceae bacterium]|nr:GNAT family N-acetyltransferase [Saprospiraceae bacterium]MBK9630788.1 GNAT family N-acetyltransferase [Saprospiraceae bacterium]